MLASAAYGEQALRVVGPHLRHIRVGVGSLARVVGVVAPGRSVGRGLALEAALVGSLAVAKPADPLRAEEEDAARALGKDDTTDRRPAAEEDPLRGLPARVPGSDRRVLLRVVDERLGGERLDGAELGRIERERRGAERRPADDRDAAVTGQRRAAEEAAPRARNNRHEAG